MNSKTTIDLDTHEIARYSRQLLLANWSLEKQQQLRTIHVLVSATLPSAAMYLTALGVGQISIYPAIETMFNTLSCLNSASRISLAPLTDDTTFFCSMSDSASTTDFASALFRIQLNADRSEGAVVESYKQGQTVPLFSTPLPSLQATSLIYLDGGVIAVGHLVRLLEEA